MELQIIGANVTPFPAGLKAGFDIPQNPTLGQAAVVEDLRVHIRFSSLAVLRLWNPNSLC